MASLCVVGSLNIDYVTRVEHLAAPGETVLADDFVLRFGGKGANQAVAAARQGAAVRMVGRVGSDDIGAAYRQRLEGEGINVSRLLNAEGPTGSAFISIDARGENMIVVAPGANGTLDAGAIDVARSAIEDAAGLLVQFETTIGAVRRAIEIAAEADVPVILNPSPLRPGFPWGELAIDYLIVNEGEAAQLGALPGGGGGSQVKNVIITRGSASTLVRGNDGDFEVPTMPVNPVDTVGAGDAFAGAFAAHFVAGTGLEESVRQANIAGALTTLSVGAQEAMPTRAAAEGG